MCNFAGNCFADDKGWGVLGRGEICDKHIADDMALNIPPKSEGMEEVKPDQGTEQNRIDVYFRKT